MRAQGTMHNTNCCMQLVALFGLISHLVLCVFSVSLDNSREKLRGRSYPSRFEEWWNGVIPLTFPCTRVDVLPPVNLILFTLPTLITLESSSLAQFMPNLSNLPWANPWRRRPVSCPLWCKLLSFPLCSSSTPKTMALAWLSLLPSGYYTCIVGFYWKVSI